MITPKSWNELLEELNMLPGSMLVNEDLSRLPPEGEMGVYIFTSDASQRIGSQVLEFARRHKGKPVVWVTPFTRRGIEARSDGMVDVGMPHTQMMTLLRIGEDHPKALVSMADQSCNHTEEEWSWLQEDEGERHVENMRRALTHPNTELPQVKEYRVYMYSLT